MNPQQNEQGTLQQSQSRNEAGNASAAVASASDLVELGYKGVAEFVVFYRYTKCVYTHRIASHMLKMTLAQAGLIGLAAEPTQKGAVTFATYVAAGLKLIEEEARDALIMEVAKAACAPIETALVPFDSSIELRLARFGDIWRVELAHTPEIEYSHTLPLNCSNFLTYVAEAELAMRNRIRATIL